MASDSESQVKIHLLFFAKSRELVSCSTGDVHSPQITSYLQLKEVILQAYPQLAVIGENIVLALNEEYIDVSDIHIQLNDKDEIAVIPPISGG